MSKTHIVLVGILFSSTSLLALGCGDEPTNGTGGAGTTSSSSSGEAGMGGSGGGAMMSAAEKYCTEIMANCTMANAQWPDATSCTNAAAAFPAGMAGDTKGNSLECRAYHATAAKMDPDTHCVHAGPAGGGSAFCGDTCEGFCDIAVATCKTEWPDKAACMTECPNILTAVMNYSTAITSGNSIECRLYHLTVAATDAASAATHCPHTKAVTAMGDPCF